MALLDQYNLTQDADFPKKVRIAMVTAAIQIVGEAQSSMTTNDWRKRHSLGVSVLNDPDGHIQRFLDATVTNAAITAASSDNDIQFQVNSVFGDIAGCGAAGVR